MVRSIWRKGVDCTLKGVERFQNYTSTDLKLVVLVSIPCIPTLVGIVCKKTCHVNFGTLHHCCIHSHKRRCQAGDKALIRGPTTQASRTTWTGQGPDKTETHPEKTKPRAPGITTSSKKLLDEEERVHGAAKQDTQTPTRPRTRR